VTLDEVYAVLSERLRFLRNDPPARRYGCVFVASIEQARGRWFDIVFLPGLAEGLFPRRSMEDPLLLDIHRKRLSKELPRQDDRVNEERLLLRLAAAAGSRLVISYPRVDIGQSRPRVPSFYAIEVLRAAEGSLPDLREFEKRLALAAPTRLGWPAPADARQALDGVEYDLATLESVHAMPAGTAKGIGRYLVEVNSCLARSLRGRWMRWSTRWSTADGIVDPDPATKEVLDAYRLANHEYSATALQQYAACPYKFLLYSVHRLRPREEAAPLEQMDPLTRGALFHEVQHRLSEKLVKAGLTPLDRHGIEEAGRLAENTLDEVAAEYEEKLAPAIGRVWASEIDDLRNDIRGWLRQVAITDSDWQPVHSELTFDGQLALDRVRVRGAIDLVEKHVRHGALRVTDHKTGKQPEQNVAYIGGGAVLQPLLYSVVAEALLGYPVDRGRLYYCTQRGAYKEIEIPFHDNARKRLAWVLDLIDKAVEEAFLPAAPNTGHCEICDYSVVCGPYESQRVRKKPQSRLMTLVELRGLP
jgi:CRISPR/Cas system-associated exonuclease Cas4 (RecB family)